MTDTNPNYDQSCPMPGCGKQGPGTVRNNVLEMTCPVHGDLKYNYETENLIKQ